MFDCHVRDGSGVCVGWKGGVVDVKMEEEKGNNFFGMGKHYPY